MRDPAWGRTVAEKTGGADLIIETGGAATLAQSIEAAAFNARIALIGMLGGVGIESDPLALIWKNLHLKGILVGSRRSLEEMTKAVAQNGLRPVIDRRFPFAEAPAAYRHLAAGAHVGKVVISHDAGAGLTPRARERDAGHDCGEDARCLWARSSPRRTRDTCAREAAVVPSR